MIQQMIYRRAEQGYRTVAASEGLMGKGLARRIEALSTLPPSGGKKRLGAQPVYSRCAVEDGLAVLMTVIDPGGIRGSHMTHAWYVQPQDAAAFAEGCAIPASAFVTEYREQSRMDGLPGVAPEDLPREDTFALGCEAARALFGCNAELLAQFLTAVARCGMPTAGRGFLGVCALSGEDEETVTVHAYRLMETVLRAYAQEQVRAVGYRSLWNKAEDNVRYPVFFTTPDLIGSEASVPMNYALLDLRAGEVRLPRGAVLEPDGHDAALAQALLGGDADGIRALQRDAEERVARRKAEEEARRRAEEERIRRAAEQKARAEEEARRRAEEERVRQAAEASRRYEEQQRLRAEEEARRRAEEAECARRAAEARRLHEEEQRRLYAEEQRRRVEEQQRRRAAEEARARETEEVRRRHEEEVRRKAEEAARAEEEAWQKRIRDEYRRKKAAEEAAQATEAVRRAEEARNEQLRRDAERYKAASSGLSAQRLQQSAPRSVRQPTANPAVPAQDDVLNRFMKALRLTAGEISPVELERRVSEQLIAVARGWGGTEGAYLEYAGQLLKEIARALRDRRYPQYAVIARCAYIIAECASSPMFRNPADSRTGGCREALDAIDELLESSDNPARRSVGRPLRDRWFVYLGVLGCEDGKADMQQCVRVIRSIRENNVNNALEHMQKKLGELASIMVEACVEKPSRSSERGQLMRRAALAMLYAEVKFNAAGHPFWSTNILLGRRLTRALSQLRMEDQFMRELDGLIDEITR